jgi:hypothetical protein
LQSALLLLNDEGLVWSSIAANPALRKFRCVQPSRDGLRPDSDPFRDGQLGVTLAVQFDDRQVSLVSRLPASLTPRFDQRQVLCFSWATGHRLSQLSSRVDLQLLKVALHRLTQIRNKMVAVGDLNRGRRALPPSIGIQTGPIASDHLDLRM